MFLPLKSPSDIDTTPCRRRPGRVENVSPELIPLLRGSAGPDASGAVTGGTDAKADDLGAASGMVFGIGLAIPLWCMIAGGVYFLLR